MPSEGIRVFRGVIISCHNDQKPGGVEMGLEEITGISWAETRDAGHPAAWERCHTA